MKKHTTFIIFALVCLNAEANVYPSNYQPSGCVEARFNTDHNGIAYDIKFDKHFPENAFLEQTFNNIKGQRFAPNQTDITNFYQYQNDNSWPLPFECMKNRVVSRESFSVNELADASYKEVKRAIDERFFLSIYNSFEITESSSKLIDNNDGTTTVYFDVKFKIDPTEALNLADYYFDVRASVTNDNQVRFAEILRSHNQEKLTKEQSNDILNYIGQRTPLIEVTFGRFKKSVAIGAPLNSERHCSGQISKRENFKKYCLTYENQQGYRIVFDNIPNEELDGKTLMPEFRIKNSYLLRLPKQTELME